MLSHTLCCCCSIFKELAAASGQLDYFITFSPTCQPLFLSFFDFFVDRRFASEEKASLPAFIRQRSSLIKFLLHYYVSAHRFIDIQYPLVCIEQADSEAVRRPVGEILRNLRLIRRRIRLRHIFKMFIFSSSLRQQIYACKAEFG